jgi:hypothetical protein
VTDKFGEMVEPVLQFAQNARLPTPSCSVEKYPVSA